MSVHEQQAAGNAVSGRAMRYRPMPRNRLLPLIRIPPHSSSGVFSLSTNNTALRNVSGKGALCKEATVYACTCVCVGPYFITPADHCSPLFSKPCSAIFFSVVQQFWPPLNEHNTGFCMPAQQFNTCHRLCFACSPVFFLHPASLWLRIQVRKCLACPVT